MMMQRIVDTQKQSTDTKAIQENFEKECDSDDEELNVDVENDDGLCPVDLTRRQHHNQSGNNSVCSDDVNSRSESPGRDEEQSPPSVVVPHQNRRLAFSVENILDPNKFTGRQASYNEGICCWKPHQESLGSPEYDGSETGSLICLVWNGMEICLLPKKLCICFI